MRTTRAWRARRAVWRIRRSTPRVARPLSRVLPDPGAPTRPILVIGCPRSGTSVLLQALLQSGELRSVQSEGHILWDEFHDPRERGWDSDALGAADVSERERRYIHRAIRLVVRGKRFVDKTPENCLRIPYLDALFPDATFVFLRRRGADNVSSLMDAWRARPRFVKYRLPEPLTGLGSLSGSQWSFALVPGWRDLRNASLEEICARQYVACNEAVLAARRRMRGRTLGRRRLRGPRREAHRRAREAVRLARRAVHAGRRALCRRPAQERLANVAHGPGDREVARAEPEGDRARPARAGERRSAARLRELNFHPCR